jgi:hypothetical protein
LAFNLLTRTALNYISTFRNICTHVVRRVWKHQWGNHNPYIEEQITLNLTRRVSLVEQELLNLSEHLSSSSVFIRVRVTRSLVLCVCFVDRCLSFCIFFIIKTEDELRCSERLNSSCSTSDTRRVRFIYLILVKTVIWSLWCSGFFPSCVLFVACFSGFPFLMDLFVFSYVYSHALK